MDPYHLEFGADGAAAADASGSGDSTPPGDAGPDALPGDARADACVPMPELCDLVDNDCDGLVDETFNTMSDPSHCGSCDTACDRPHTFGTCALGMCEFECLPGYHDINLDIDLDGCEYACLVTNGGTEACDGLDNDCDTLFDEDFDLTSDVGNCGACGRVCQAIHASAACVASTCGYSSCDAGFADVLPGVAGCEYTCPVFPTETETCDGEDDDCDGVADQGNPGGGLPCGGGAGACTPGVTTCLFGTLVCFGEGSPQPETCNNLDDDCDGIEDDGFDKQNDPRYCGDCTPCDLPFAIEGCSMGVCTVVACNAGHVDLDGDPANGCEYACTPLGPEVCDGQDNDCDGEVDTADASLLVPGNFCVTSGACAGTTPTCGPGVCDPSIQWRCVYGADVETDACGGLVLQETRCDGLDGDCDAAADDAFPLAGTPCSDAGIGICRGTGLHVCNAAGDGVECVITTPGALPMSELCNGLDDDCNGLLDDGAPDAMVHVVEGAVDYWIDRYEAARPDATATDGGVLEHRSCSRAGVLPWRSVTWTEADAACAAAGKRLCTEAEWQTACEGPLDRSYPYGNSYSATACNGGDYDHDCGGANDDVLLPTETAYGCPPPPATACVSGYDAVDMSGNLKEWTSTQVGASPPAYRVRGGAYDNISGGLTCQFDFVSFPDDYFFTNLGFRCCADVGP